MYVSAWVLGIECSFTQKPFLHSGICSQSSQYMPVPSSDFSPKAGRKDATLLCIGTRCPHSFPTALQPSAWFAFDPLLLAESSPKIPWGQGLDPSALWHWSDEVPSEYLFNWPAARLTCSRCDEVGFRGQGSPEGEGYLGSSAVAQGPEWPRARRHSAGWLGCCGHWVNRISGLQVTLAQF